jgi:uncharacterized membrane protein YdjX (TVP38/TMEM64 family)
MNESSPPPGARRKASLSAEGSDGEPQGLAAGGEAADREAERLAKPPVPKPSVIDVAPSPWRPVAALALVGIAIVVFFALGLDRYVRPDTLREYDELFRSWAELRRPLAVLAFMVAFMLVALAALPAVAFMGVLSGFLFGPVAGVIYAYASAMISALLTYLGARYAFRDAVIRRRLAMVVRMEAAFGRNPVLVLVFIRFLPVIPFWTANALPAVLGVPLGAFLVATAIGVIPGSVLLPNLGHGIHEVVTSGEEDLEVALLGNPHVVVPVVIGTALLVGALVWRSVSSHRRRAAARRA